MNIYSFNKKIPGLKSPLPVGSALFEIGYYSRLLAVAAEIILGL